MSVQNLWEYSVDSRKNKRELNQARNESMNGGHALSLEEEFDALRETSDADFVRLSGELTTIRVQLAELSSVSGLCTALAEKLTASTNIAKDWYVTLVRVHTLISFTHVIHGMLRWCACIL